MGSTISEKILANVAKKEVITNEIVDVSPDLIMSNDATTHITIDIFKEKMGGIKVKHPENLLLVIDHNVPSNSVETAMVHKKMRDFAKAQGIKLYDGEGVCHQLLLENHVIPNQIIVGADSHTCTLGALGAFATGIGSTDMAAVWGTGKIWLKVPPTIKFEIKGRLPEGVYAKDLILKIIGDIGTNGATYKAMEFTGPTVRNLSMDSRFTLCNMAVEAGAKNGIIEPDEKTLEYISKRTSKRFDVFKSDSNAEYEKIYEYDANELEPMIACPHSVGNVRPVKEVEGLKIHEAFIGSFTNGRLEDLRIAAKILEENKVHPDVRLIITPVSREVYIKALEDGILDTFVDAGAMITHPCCGLCAGSRSGGIIADGERVITSTNRNYLGRLGGKKSEAYLASPATVVMSAINGVITSPTYG